VEVSTYIVDAYVKLRKLQADQEKQNKTHAYTSARTLLGVIRLAQAHARLRFANEVEVADVDEALRLTEASKESLYDDEEKEFESDRSITSKIYRIILSMMPAKRKGGRLGRGPARERDMDVDEEEEEDQEVSMVDVRARVLAKKFTEEQLRQTIQEVGGFLLYPDWLLMFYFSMRAWTF
jgi:DNA replication licensing factor MCM7